MVKWNKSKTLHSSSLSLTFRVSCDGKGGWGPPRSYVPFGDSCKDCRPGKVQRGVGHGEQETKVNEYHEEVGVLRTEHIIIDNIFSQVQRMEETKDKISTMFLYIVRPSEVEWVSFL